METRQKPKHRKHRGHIIERGKIYYVVVSQGYDENGKRIRQWIPVSENKKDAVKRLAELLCELDNGTFVKPSKETVKEFMLDWLAYVKNNLAPRTYEGYEHIIQKHITKSAIASTPLTRLTTPQLRKYFDEKLNGNEDGDKEDKHKLSPLTVRHHHMLLHNALNCALKWGRVQRNVMDTISPPKCQSYEARTMTERDMWQALEMAKGVQYYPLFHTSLHTGMRLSELLALRWGDIDFILSEIRVRRSLHQVNGGQIVVRDTKTARSKRNIKMTPSSHCILAEHYENRRDVCAILGVRLMDDGYVFSHADGSPLLPDTVSHAWIKLMRKAGLKGIRFHDCRHTHASILLAQGIHPKVVQERLGHSSIQVTLDLYSHVAPGLQEEAAKAFSKAFEKALQDELGEASVSNPLAKIDYVE